MKLYIDCQFETILACPLCVVALWINKEIEGGRDNSEKITKGELVRLIDREVERGAIVYEEHYLYPDLINYKGLTKTLKTKIEFIAAKLSYQNKNLELVLCRAGLPDSNYYKTSLETNTLEAQITKIVSTSRREWLIKNVFGPCYKQYNWTNNLALCTEDHSMRIISKGINHLFILENLKLVGLSWNKAYKKLKSETIMGNVYAGQPPAWWLDFIPNEPFGVINTQVTGTKDPSFIDWICNLAKPNYSVKYLFDDYVS